MTRVAPIAKIDARGAGSAVGGERVWREGEATDALHGDRGGGVHRVAPL
jgi:hypothetical protein